MKEVIALICAVTCIWRCAITLASPQWWRIAYTSGFVGMSLGANAFVWLIRPGNAIDIQIAGSLLTYGCCVAASPGVILFAKSLLQPEFPKRTFHWSAAGATITLGLLVVSAMLMDWTIGPDGKAIRSGPAAVAYSAAFYCWMGIVMAHSAHVSFAVTRWRRFPRWQMRDVSHAFNFAGSALALVCLAAFCWDIFGGKEVPGAETSVFVAVLLITIALAVIPLARVILHIWTVACIWRLHKDLLKHEPTAISFGHGLSSGIEGKCSRMTIEICDVLDRITVDPGQPLADALTKPPSFSPDQDPASHQLEASETEEQLRRSLRRLGRTYIAKKVFS